MVVPGGTYVLQLENHKLMRKRKLAPIRNLEEFGLRNSDLLRLGMRPVEVELRMPIPPFAYPDSRMLKRMLSITPADRRKLVHEWSIRKFAAFRRELPDLQGQILTFNGDPHGMCVTIEARKIPALRFLKNADSICIKAIKGIRRKRISRRNRNSPIWYAVRGILTHQAEGQNVGAQLYHDSIVAVRGRSEEEAIAKAKKAFRKQEYATLLTTGHLNRVVFDRIIDAAIIMDDFLKSHGKLSPNGSEIYYDVCERIIATKKRQTNSSRTNWRTTAPRRRGKRQR